MDVLLSVAGLAVLVAPFLVIIWRHEQMTDAEWEAHRQRHAEEILD